MSEIFLVLRRFGRDMIIGLHVKYLLVLSDITLKILDRFSKNNHVSNFMKIRPVGEKLFHVDERTNERTDRQTDGQIRRN